MKNGLGCLLLVAMCGCLEDTGGFLAAHILFHEDGEVVVMHGSDGANGFHCWDLNENHIADVLTEDLDHDGFVSVYDCQGPRGAPGINCWDTDGDHENDLDEDVNGDGLYSALDCQGADGTTGDRGEPGTNGTDGTNGTNGADGADAGGPPFGNGNGNGPG